MEKITISKLAKLVGINGETIRYYHREGILREPVKSANGYRYYNEDHVLRLNFIKKAKDLGFTLREIRELLDLTKKSKTTCLSVKAKAEIKISELDLKIADLKKIKESLQELCLVCDAGISEVKQFRVMDCFNENCEC